MRDNEQEARPWRYLALGLSLGIHLVAAILLAWGMRTPIPQQRVHRDDDALQVRLIALPAALRMVPSPQRSSPTSPSPGPPRTPQRIAATAPVVPLPSEPVVTPPPRLNLYDRQGNIVLAPSQAGPAPSAYVQRAPQGDSQVMDHTRALAGSPTRFDAAFPPPNENLKQQLIRKTVQTVGKPFAVRLPGGIHLKCNLLTGCQDPPAPPSAKDGDERLSMAPASPLAPLPADPPLPEADCIAIFRAGKPLPHGCPVDTPNRAVDEQVHRLRADRGEREATSTTGPVH